MTGVIIARADARAQELTHYYTGKPCISGHSARRFVSSGHCTECLREWKTTWRDGNREKVNEQARKDRAANLPKVKARYKRWQSTAEGRAIKARLQRERRGRIRGAGGTHSLSDVVAILDRQGGKCVYCKTDIRERYEVDHIKALASGGSNCWTNIQVTCPSCNRRKRTKPSAQFAQEMGCSYETPESLEIGALAD
jgi:5-methylcytosine-specific restriction endonuclease McrA